MTIFNTYRGAAIFGSLPVAFRYPSGVRVKLQCDSVAPLTELCNPSGILAVYVRRAGKSPFRSLTGLPSWPRPPDHQNGLESFRRAESPGLPQFSAIKRSVNKS